MKHLLNAISFSFFFLNIKVVLTWRVSNSVRPSVYTLTHKVPLKMQSTDRAFTHYVKPQFCPILRKYALCGTIWIEHLYIYRNHRFCKLMRICPMSAVPINPIRSRSLILELNRKNCSFVDRVCPIRFFEFDQKSLCVFSSSSLSQLSLMSLSRSSDYS